MNNPVRRRMLELSKDDVLNIQETFKFFDVDKKGYLDYYELKAALRALGSQVKKAEVLRIIGAYDKQREGYQKRICYEDFYYVAADKMVRQDPMEQMKYAFKLFVSDRSNKGITYKDLKRVVDMIGEDIDDQDIRGMIDTFDNDAVELNTTSALASYAIEGATCTHCHIRSRNKDNECERDKGSGGHGNEFVRSHEGK
uniref:EF-hand domain-containing protein n=1 Tax=Timema shepardi TaxID=629360 RepID=A0A7R9AXU0_TIMSH|nr:unnamed protein product [Timema shepardi]